MFYDQLHFTDEKLRQKEVKYLAPDHTGGK